jgi:hypothetical protein
VIREVRIASNEKPDFFIEFSKSVSTLVERIGRARREQSAA